MIGPKPYRPHDNAAIHDLAETRAWIEALIPKARDAAANFDLSIFLGGDHSLSAGTVTGVAEYAAAQGRPLYVLWLDAHPDLHTLDSTQSGNLHGTPAGYFIGLNGFDAYPERKTTVAPDHLCMVGLRSIDPAETRVIAELGLETHSTAALHQHGPALLKPFLDRVRANNGLLHVSFDVDILDPSIAPGIGTPAPQGATLGDIQRIMAALRDSGLVKSLDLVELNPLLDHDAQTSLRICDVVATLLTRPMAVCYQSGNRSGFSEPGLRTQS